MKIFLFWFKFPVLQRDILILYTPTLYTFQRMYFFTFTSLGKLDQYFCPHQRLFELYFYSSKDSVYFSHLCVYWGGKQTAAPFLEPET